MRTNLKILKSQLFYHVINKNFQSILGNLNQKAFMLAFFPLSFLTSEENQGVICTHSNNSSRLSNIFSRAMDTKRIESKFRDRFLNAFDYDFYHEMIENTKYYLRAYNSDAFEAMIERTLSEDEELMHSEFSKIIKTSYKTQAEVALTVLVLWAFHIGDFRPLLDIMTNYRMNHNKMETGLSDIQKIIDEKKLKPAHVAEYLDIATTYGIQTSRGAIAMYAKAENSSEINPLIYDELASMQFSGNFFQRENREKGLSLFKESATQNYGPSQWTVAILTNTRKHKLTYNKFETTYDLFNKALDNGNIQSLNNIGTAFHSALVYYMKDFKYISDCFSVEARRNTMEVYFTLKSDQFFISLINKHMLDYDYDDTFIGNLTLLDHITDAEDDILVNYFEPAIEKEYFYAIGSKLMIYQTRYKRYKNFYNTYQLDYAITDHAKHLKILIEETCEAFSKYPCTESYYKYGKLLESKGSDYIQTAYEYYYSAVYVVPRNYYKYQAISALIRLHHHPLVDFKRHDVDVESLAYEVINNYEANSLSDETILFDIMTHVHSKDIVLSQQLKDKIINNLTIELNKNRHLADEYKYMINSI